MTSKLYIKQEATFFLPIVIYAYFKIREHLVQVPGCLQMMVLHIQVFLQALSNVDSFGFQYGYRNPVNSLVASLITECESGVKHDIYLLCSSGISMLSK